MRAAIEGYIILNQLNSYEYLISGQKACSNSRTRFVVFRNVPPPAFMLKTKLHPWSEFNYFLIEMLRENRVRSEGGSIAPICRRTHIHRSSRYYSRLVSMYFCDAKTSESDLKCEEFIFHVILIHRQDRTSSVGKKAAVYGNAGRIVRHQNCKTIAAQR